MGFRRALSAILALIVVALAPGSSPRPRLDRTPSGKNENCAEPGCRTAAPVEKEASSPLGFRIDVDPACAPEFFQPTAFEAFVKAGLGCMSALSTPSRQLAEEILMNVFESPEHRLSVRCSHRDPSETLRGRATPMSDPLYPELSFLKGESTQKDFRHLFFHELLHLGGRRTAAHFHAFRAPSHIEVVEPCAACCMPEIEGPARGLPDRDSCELCAGRLAARPVSEIHRTLAQSQLRLGHSAQALAIARLAVVADAASRENWETLARVLLTRVEIALQAKRVAIDANEAALLLLALAKSADDVKKLALGRIERVREAAAQFDPYLGGRPLRSDFEGVLPYRIAQARLELYLSSCDPPPADSADEIADPSLVTAACQRGLASALEAVRAKYPVAAPKLYERAPAAMSAEALTRAGYETVAKCRQDGGSSESCGNVSAKTLECVRQASATPVKTLTPACKAFADCALRNFKLKNPAVEKLPPAIACPKP